MSLTPRLKTVTGPTKSVIDPGPVQDPALDVIAGVGQIADAAFGAYKDLQANQKAAAAASRQAKADQRADIKFAQSQEDRRIKQEDDRFQDAAAAAIRTIGKTQSASDQGRLPSSAIRLETEKAVTSLLTEFPAYDAELNKVFKEAGLSHLILGAVEDEVSRAEAEREAVEKGQATMYQAAVDRGVIGPNTSYEQGVAIGREILNVQTQAEQLKDQAELIKASTEMKREDQKFQLELLDRQSVQVTARAASTLGGATVTGLVSEISNISTVEQFSDLQKQGAQKVAELEGMRQQLYAMSGYNEDAMERADASIDQYKEIITDALSGDLSYAKQVATRLDTIQKNGKLQVYETIPAMSILEAYPKSFTDGFFGTLGTQLAGDTELTKGLSDKMAGLVTQHSELWDDFDKEFKSDSPITNIRNANTQRKVLKATVHTQKEALKNVFSSTSNLEKPEALQEFTDANGKLLPVLAREIGETRDSLEEIEAASNVLFTPEAIQGIEAAMANPATSVAAANQMTSTRKLMHRSIQSLKRNTRSVLTPFSVRFDPSVGRFEVGFDRDRAEKIARTAVTPGHAFAIAFAPEGAIDSQVQNMEERGQRDKVQRKVAQMNKMLDLLVRTRQHDSSVSAGTTDLEYRTAYATNDFSKIQVTDPTGIDPNDLSVVETPQQPSVPLAKNATTASVMASQFKTEDSETAAYIDASAASVGVPAALMHAIADQESGAWQGAERHKIRGDGGKAKGIFQMHRAAATDAGFDWEELDDPAKNAQAASVYMSQLLDDFKGDVTDSLLAYNAGETKIRSWIRRGRPEGEPWQKNAMPYAAKVLERIEQQSTETEKETKVDE